MRVFLAWRRYDPGGDVLWPQRCYLVAWTAIGTLALAIAAVATIVVTSAQGRNDRLRVSAERLAEIKRDDDKRAQDRAHDDERRAQDRERDDRLRREATEARERQEVAERRVREDYEARQTVVKLTPKLDSAAWFGQDAEFTHQITVSAPHTYPIKWVDGRWVLTGNGNFGTVDFGFSIDTPIVDENWTRYTFRAKIPATDLEAQPVIRFVDWHGNQYFQYRNYTERFSQDTDFPRSRSKARSVDQDRPETGLTTRYPRLGLVTCI